MALLRVFKSVKPIAGFHVEEAPATARHTAEIFATVRPNGRILDDVRYVLGGTHIVEGEFKLGLLLEDPGLKDWAVHLQRWPRDLQLKKGLLSSLWIDISTMVSSRDAAVFDNLGAGIPAAEFLRRLLDDDEEPMPAAVRWSVVLNDRARLALQLQGLPAHAASLNNKPSYKR